MTTFQFWNAFRTFSADVLGLALGVTLLVSLLKKTVMKNCSRKVFVFLPFVIGTAVYAVYSALITMSAAPFTKELCTTIEKGFSCGLAATLYYVLYEQFFRSSKTQTASDPLSLLIDGIVPEEKKEEAKKALEQAANEASEEELLLTIKATLGVYAAEELNEAEAEFILHILVKYFSLKRMTV